MKPLLAQNQALRREIQALRADHVRLLTDKIADAKDALFSQKINESIARYNTAIRSCGIHKEEHQVKREFKEEVRRSPQDKEEIEARYVKKYTWIDFDGL